jgi:hypothetical protein
MGEKVEVSIDAEGNVLKCAKSLASGECGYTPGAKVCGKCGAMPIEMKMVPVDTEEKGGDWMMDEEKPKKKGGMSLPEDMLVDDEEQEEETASIPTKKKGGMNIEIESEDEEDEDTEEDEEEKGYGASMGVDLDAARKRRLMSMGEKSAEYGRNAYMCAVERKVYPGGASVCDDCPGGCVAEKGMPGLLSVEGIAESMFDGKVLDSGYSSDADMFVE